MNKMIRMHVMHWKRPWIHIHQIIMALKQAYPSWTRLDKMKFNSMEKLKVIFNACCHPNFSKYENLWQSDIEYQYIFECFECISRLKRRTIQWKCAQNFSGHLRSRGLSHSLWDAIWLNGSSRWIRGCVA